MSITQLSINGRKKSVGDSSQVSIRLQAKQEDKEFAKLKSPDNGSPLPLEDVSTDPNSQDEFVHLLYNDIVETLMPNWHVTNLEKIVVQRDSQEEVTGETDTNNENEESDEFNEIKLDEVSDKELSSSVDYVKVVFPNRTCYTGCLIHRQMDRDGIYQWGSGEIYKGEFERNSIEGQGHFEWNDQSWYEGKFHKGFRHGTGNLISHEYGRFYTGKWRMGHKHGNGYCHYDNAENFYEGEWNMGRRHGNGYRLYTNGVRYIGQWEHDRQHGLGTMVWPNGDVYRGEWENGRMNGYGEYVWNGFLNKSLSWPQENCYRGEWLNGMRHGKGVLKLNSVGGATYSGDWYMDKKHGYGMIIGNSGAVTEADPLFLDNVLTPLDIHAIHLANPTLEPDSDPELSNSASKMSTMKYKEPRITKVLKPLQFPSLWFHIQRLFKFQNYSQQSSATTISSGKCYVCSNESTCSCLTNYSPSLLGTSVESKSMEVSAIVSSFFGRESMNTSSESCAHTENCNEEGNRTGRTQNQYEKHWVHNCITTHMVQLRKIYKIYAELYCSEKGIHHRLSMSKISLLQLMRDCQIHTKGISLVQLEQYVALNKSAFIEAVHYPFERIDFYQYIHTLLEVAWHLYTKLNDIEMKAMPGRLAGGLHKLLVQDIFPNAGKHIGNVSSIYRDLLPIYSVYQLYCDIGEPHTVKKFLRATCFTKTSSDLKPSARLKPKTTMVMPYLMDGINAITIGEKLSYISSEKASLKSHCLQAALKYEDDLAFELLALRHIGVPKMVSIIAKICPAIKDQETNMIINMDYELTFLEFYEILLEATKILIYMRKVATPQDIYKTVTVAEILAESPTCSQSVQSIQFKRQSLQSSKVKRELA